MTPLRSDGYRCELARSAAIWPDDLALVVRLASCSDLSCASIRHLEPAARAEAEASPQASPFCAMQACPSAVVWQRPGAQRWHSPCLNLTTGTCEVASMNRGSP